MGRDPSHCAVHALVGGRVQGVGFRWFVMREARALGVRGWVRNRMDGDVELHAEGDRRAVDALLAAVARGPSSGRVDHVERSSVDPKGTYRGFEIVS